MRQRWETYLPKLSAAARALGLQPIPSVYEEVDRETLHELAAYGIPGVHGHWLYGRAYWQHESAHDRGLETIYELVCHLEPAVTYLLADNRWEEQLFVLAHVQGHLDFFGRNHLMRQQNPHMHSVMAAASERWHGYAAAFGAEAVEAVMDVGFMFLSHVNPHAGHKRPAETPTHAVVEELMRPRGRFDDLLDLGRPATKTDGRVVQGRVEVHRGDALALPKEAAALERWLAEQEAQGVGEEDVLYVLAHATSPPLPEWKRDILIGMRELALYFLPQRRTKLLDEGWASYWEGQLLDALELPEEAHLISAEMHSRIAGTPSAGGRLNVYWLGCELFRHLERQGRDVFEIAAVEDDQSFLRTWLDEDFVRRHRVLAEAVYGDEGKRLFQDPTAPTKKPWEVWRDRLAESFAVAPALPVRVHENTRGRFVLHTVDGQVPDDVYARRVLGGLRRLFDDDRDVVLRWGEGRGEELRA
jgi:stage V sporulation protein R